MSDLLHQNLATVQSGLQQSPRTFAAAATIAPDTFLSFISGTTQIGTITPPVTGSHMLILIFTDASPGTLLTTGNINNAVIPTQNLPTILVYNPVDETYSGGTMNLT